MNYGFGLTLFIGVCVSYTAATPSCICPRNEAPVCGSDGKTYTNECILTCYQQMSPDLILVRHGQCGPASLCVCTDEYAPVCGSDDVTYPNKCALDCEAHVQLKHNGACIQDLCACHRNLVPMCGTDGKSYANKCLLECARQENKDLGLSHMGFCKNEVQ